MDKTETMIRQNVYLPNIINVVRKEVTSCYTCQRKKRPKKNGKLPAKESKEIPRNKLLLD